MGSEWWAQAENLKSLGLLIFFVTFCLIVLWIYSNRDRSNRLEEQKNIPFLDDDHD
ncbi:MAG: cbb3-type cytochrome c oxidase subunit 3 [Parasulfuritortus sp.]|jgi:cbb3-type cytochrome oxidase subunit 3|nr:cbb3-type cytochrome c oxidase subunit 3 [Parasulfuritortus sp.]